MFATLPADVRSRAGKGAARQVRREGKVPAVIYGNKNDPKTIAIDANELGKMLKRGGFFSTVFDIQFDGNTERCIPRDVQFDPVKDFAVHVDFQRVSEDGRVRVAVPVNFLNRERSVGMKRGGALNIARRTVEVFCPADTIPAKFEIDLARVNIGTSIHISDVKLPAGVEPTISDRDFTIATIVGKGGKMDAIDDAAEEDEAETAAEQSADADGAEGGEGGDTDAANNAE
ncbi:MAG: 50S ribosomal protein L25/general stress protein Ctc [Pseudomonadota bacterium]